jgi:hypothetical protein
MIRSLFNNPFALTVFTREFFEGDNGGGAGGGAGAGGGTGAGGGAAGGKEGDKGGKKDDKTEETVALKKSDLDKQIADSVKSALDKKTAEDAETKKKADEEAARKDAEKKGEHQKLYEQEKAAREKAEKDRDDQVNAAKLDARKKDADVMLRDYLSEKHADYAKSATYIRPLITVDLTTKDEDLKKSIEKAVEQFVKDNPRRPTFGTPPSRTSLPAGTKVPEGENKGGDQRRVSDPIRRGF